MRHFGRLSLIVILLASCAEEGDVSSSSLSKWEYFDQGDGLASDRVLALFEDRSNNLWIGTDAGVNFYNGNSFIQFDTSDGLVSNVIYAIEQDDDGNIWVGTDSGINISIDEEWFYFPAFDGVVVTALLKLSNGDILIGTEDFGAAFYSSSQDNFFEFYYDNFCSACNFINAFLEQDGGTVWIGTEGGLKQIKGNSVTSFTTSQGLPDNSVRSIVADNWGNIWIGTFDGNMISRYTNAKWENIDIANFLAQSWVWDLEIDNEGILWVTTVVGGLYRYDGAVMRKDFDNLPDENMSSLLRDSKGNMWVGTLFSGLIKYTP